MDKKIHLDFVTGIVLMLLSVSVIVESARISFEVGGAYYSSPGMMPTVLGILLLFTGFLLFRRSVKEVGVAQNIVDLKNWFAEIKKSHTVREMLLGGAILAVYTFLLAPRLPFWLSTSAFLLFIMGFLNATSLLNNVLITSAVVGSIYFVFQIVFHVPLP